MIDEERREWENKITREKDAAAAAATDMERGGERRKGVGRGEEQHSNEDEDVFFSYTVFHLAFS